MTYRSRGRSANELMAAIIFAGFLAGFIIYLCFGNYQRAKRAMERQRRRRIELEEEKRALALSPGGGSSSVGFNGRRRNVSGNGNNYDSPKSNLSGSSSMYTDEKGLTERIGGVNVAGNQSHMLLGGDATNLGSRVIPQAQVIQQQPRDFLDNDEELSV